MITREQKESNGRAATARELLGQTIKWHREDRKRTLRESANRLRISVSVLQDMEAGRYVPTSEEWAALTNGVHRGLQGFHELYLRAKAEQKAEQNMVTNGINTHVRSGTPPPTKVATNLGSKLAEAINRETTAAHASIDEKERQLDAHGYGGKAPVPPEQIAGLVTPTPPPSKPDLVMRSRQIGGRKSQAGRPPGSMSAEAVQQRHEWARLQFRARPKMPVGGPDGLLVMMRQRFGVGLDPDEAQRIKAEVYAELQLLPPAVPPGIVAKPVPTNGPPERVEALQPRVTQPMAAVADPSDGDITTAVQLILGAIPGLETFTISVDESGEASVDWQIRKIVVQRTGGSIKVQR